MRKHCKSSGRTFRWDGIKNLLGFGSKQCDCGGRKKRSYFFEPLEERQLLSVCHWTNAVGDGQWGTAGNWAENCVPATNDDVYFNSQGTPAVTNNNITGLNLHSVTITQPGYELAGCPISVTDCIFVDLGSGTSKISLDVATTSATTLNIGENSQLWESGVLSTSGSLAKTGAGTLVLTDPNSSSPAVQGGALIRGNANLAPYVSVAGAASVNEGSSYTLQLSSTVALQTSPAPWQITNWGDGNTGWADGMTAAPTNTYADGTQNLLINANVTDSNGGVATITKAIKVNNIAPQLKAFGDTVEMNVGDYTLHLSSYDPGDDTIDHWTIDWRDGSQIETVAGTLSSVTHTYTTPGTYGIVATAFDDDGPQTVAGSAGKLDATFGVGGTVLVNAAQTSERDAGCAVGVQEDGKIVVASVRNPSGNIIYLTRYVPNNLGTGDKTVDTAFGTDGNGIVKINMGDLATVSSLAIDSNNRIVVTGTVSCQPFVLRYAADGTDFDHLFNPGGPQQGLLLNYGGQCVAVLPDDKILVGGTSTITRLNPDGSVDTTYPGVISSRALAVQADGKTVVASTVKNRFRLTRYNSNGTVDTSFGSRGIATPTFGGNYEEAYSVTIQPDGKILVAGITDNGANGTYDMAIARYKANGQLDTTFGVGGKVKADFGSFDYAYGMAIQQDGCILVTGNGNNGDTALARYLPGNATVAVKQAVSTWTGLGRTPEWTDPANWAGNVVPLAGDAIVFSGSTRTTSHNDFAAGTTFSSITFASTVPSGFTLTGEAITLTNGITANNSSATVSLDIALTGAATMSVAGSLTLDHPLSGSSGSLTKTGSGTLILAAANSFGSASTTNVTVNGGILLATSPDALLHYDSHYAIVVNAGAIGGSVATSGHWTQGTLATLVSNVEWASVNASLAIDTTNGNYEYANDISNPSGAAIGLVKLGSNVLTLSGHNTYTGGTIVNGGTLQLGNGTINGSVLGDIVNNASVVFNTSAADQSFGGVISGLGHLTKSGAYDLTLSGDNSTFNGLLTVSKGRLLDAVGPENFGNPFEINVIGDGQLFASHGASYDLPLIIAGSGVAGLGALQLGDGATWAGDIVLTDDARITASDGDATITGNISGPHALILCSGNASATNSTITLAPSIANTYANGTLIAGVTVRLASDNGLPANGALELGDSTLGSGVLDLNGHNLVLSSLTTGAASSSHSTFWDAISNTNASLLATLTISVTTDCSYDGLLWGNFALDKRGAGELTLSGQNLNTGDATVYDGTLKIDVSYIGDIVKAAGQGTPNVIAPNATWHSFSLVPKSGEYADSFSGDLLASSSPAYVVGDWRAAVMKSVGGSLSGLAPLSSYTFGAPLSGQAFRVGTVGELDAAIRTLHGGSDAFDLDNTLSPETRVIVVESTFGRDDCDYDYDDVYWIVSDPPTVSLSGTLADTLYTLNLNIQDPNGDAIAACFVDWGDGSDPDGDGFIGQRIAGNPTQLTHTFSQTGCFTIQVQAKDSLGAVGHEQIAVLVGEVTGGSSGLPYVYGLQVVRNPFSTSITVPLVRGYVGDNDSVNLLPVEFDVNGDGLADGTVIVDGDGSSQFTADLSGYVYQSGTITASFRAGERNDDGNLVYGGWASITFQYEPPTGSSYTPSPHVPSGSYDAGLINSTHPISTPVVAAPTGVNAVVFTGGALSGATYDEYAYRWNPTFGYSWTDVNDPDPTTTTSTYSGRTVTEIIDSAVEKHSTWVSATDWDYTATCTYHDSITTVYVGTDTSWSRTQIADYTYTYTASRRGDSVDYSVNESATTTLDFVWSHDTTSGMDVIDDDMTETWTLGYERADTGHRSYLSDSVFTATETTEYDATNDFHRGIDYVRQHTETGNDSTSEWHEIHDSDWSYGIDSTYQVAADGSWTKSQTFDYDLADDDDFTDVHDQLTATHAWSYPGSQQSSTLDKQAVFHRTTSIDYSFDGVTNTGSAIATQSNSDYSYVEDTDDDYNISSVETVNTDDQSTNGVVVAATSICTTTLDRVRSYDETRDGRLDYDGGVWTFGGDVTCDNRTTGNWSTTYSNTVDGSDNSVAGTTRSVHTTQSGVNTGTDTYHLSSSGTHNSDSNGFSQYVGATDIWQTSNGTSAWSNTGVSDASGTSQTGWSEDLTTTVFSSHGQSSGQGTGQYTAQSYGREERLANGEDSRWGNSSHSATAQGQSDGSYTYDSTIDTEKHPTSGVTETSEVISHASGTTHGAFNGSSVGSATYDNNAWDSTETDTCHQTGDEQSSLTEDATSDRVDTNTSGLIVNSHYTSHYLENRNGNYAADYTSQTDDASGAVALQVATSANGKGDLNTSRTYSGSSNTVDKAISNIVATTDATFSGSETTKARTTTAANSQSTRYPSGAAEHTSSTTYVETGDSDTTSHNVTVYSLDDQRTSLRRRINSTATDDGVGSGEYTVCRSNDESGDLSGNYLAHAREDNTSSQASDTTYNLVSVTTVNGTDYPTWDIDRTIDSTDNYTEDRVGHSMSGKESHSLTSNYNYDVTCNYSQHEETADIGSVIWSRKLDSTTDLDDRSRNNVYRTDNVHTVENSNGTGDYSSTYYFDKVVADEQWSSVTKYTDDAISNDVFNRVADSTSHYEDLTDQYFDRYADSTSHVVETGDETVTTHSESSDARLLNGTVTSYSLREETVHAVGDSDSTVHEDTTVNQDQYSSTGMEWASTTSVTIGSADRNSTSSFIEDTFASRESINGATTVQSDDIRTEEGTFDGTSSSDTTGTSYSDTSTKYEECDFTAYQDATFSGEYESAHERHETVNSQGRTAFSDASSYSETGTTQNDHGSTNDGYNEITEWNYSPEQYLSTGSYTSGSSGTTTSNYTSTNHTLSTQGYSGEYTNNHDESFAETGTTTWESSSTSTVDTDDDRDSYWTIASDYSSHLEDNGTTNFNDSSSSGYNHSNVTSSTDWSESANSETSTFGWVRDESATTTKNGTYFDLDLYYWCGYSNGGDETITSSYVSTEDGAGMSTLVETSSTVDGATNSSKHVTENDSADYTLIETNTNDADEDYPTSEFDGQGHSESSASSSVTTVGTWTYDEASDQVHNADGTWSEDGTVANGNVGTKTTHNESNATGHEAGVGQQGCDITSDSTYTRTEDETDNFNISKSVHTVRAVGDSQATVTTRDVAVEDGTSSWDESSSKDTTAVSSEQSSSSGHRGTSDVGSGSYTASSDITEVTGAEYDRWGFSDYTGSSSGTIGTNSSETVRTTRGPYQAGDVTRTTVALYTTNDNTSGNYSISSTKNITYVDPWITQYEGGSSGTIDTSGTGSETKSLTYVTVTDTSGDHYSQHVERSESRAKTTALGHTTHKTYSVTLDSDGSEQTPVEVIDTTETKTSTYTKTFDETGTYTGTAGSSFGHGVSVPSGGDPCQGGFMLANSAYYDEVIRTWHNLDEQLVTKGETVSTHDAQSTRTVWREETTHTLHDSTQDGSSHHEGEGSESNAAYQDSWHFDKTHTEHRNADGSGWADDQAEFEYHRPVSSSDSTSGSGDTYYHSESRHTDDRTANKHFHVVVYADGTSLITVDAYSHNYDTTSHSSWASASASGWSNSTSYDTYSRSLDGATMSWTQNQGGTTTYSNADPYSWSNPQFGSSPATVAGNYCLTVDGPETWSSFFSDVSNSLDYSAFQVWNEMLNFASDPGAYTQEIVSATLDGLYAVGTRAVDAFAGWVDGVVTTINPFQKWFDATVFGHSIFGNDAFYNGGYVAGVVTGIAGQIVVGAMSGGCSLFAAGSTLARLAQAYTAVDTVMGMVGAAQNIANGKGGLGDVLAFAPAVGYGASKLGLLCFAQDTQVVVDVNADGSYVTRNIQDIQVGDYVLCRDQDDPDAPLVKKQVTETFAHETEAVRRLSIKTASGNVETITTTDDHPFWVDHIGWMAAKDLATGVVVTTADGGTAVVVENYSQLLDSPVSVYNLEVSDGHTYFVEDGQGVQSAIWVHNNCQLSKALGIVAGSGQEGAHLVALGKFARRSATVQEALGTCRTILGKVGIGLNEAANGFKTTTRNHLGTHTDKFFLALRDMLVKAEQTQGGVEAALDEIRTKVLSGVFNQ